MRCKRCGAGWTNDIHQERTRPDYHEFDEPPEGQVVLSLEERIDALERAVAELKEERTT